MKLHEGLFVFVLLLWFIASFMIHGSNHHERKPYIVYMGDLPAGSPSTTVADDHHNLLLDAIGDEKIARESKIYSYGKSFNGFAARLLPDEATKLSDEESVVSVFESRKKRVLTTRSWEFLGLNHQYSKRNPLIESNLIVAVFDTGIWIDSPSFSDEGYGPPPPKWKGKCVTGPNFTACNNKVIGANYFDLDKVTSYPELSVADTDGHGSHIASTVAGSAVAGASLYGLAKGTARGGVPSARIAVYKVCWSVFCNEMDVLAAFDEAIADGVDLISVSIGSPPMDFFRDGQAIGAFHAMKKGILTTTAAGNDGPELFTVENVAPWIMTVAATGIDRGFVTAFELGNGNKFTKQMHSLTSGAKAAFNNGTPHQGNASACDPNAMNQSKVKGKIVYCLKTYTDPSIKSLGGTGVIQLTQQQTDYSSILLLPGATIPSVSGKYIDLYINSTKNPKAVIYKSETVKIDAPFVASFSSRGPQRISSNILKPDLSAPGIDILAAYTKLATLTGDTSDSRYSFFTVMSGTSMACSHATAAAAYVKSFHPDWSPAAVKSALMTTATPMKIKSEDVVLGSGAGQINPTKAVHPGLVYNISFDSYISFLCKEGYNNTTIGLLGGSKKYNCSKIKPAQGTDGLNYPTMHKQLSDPSSAIEAVFYRTVTHVGYGASLYRANISSPDSLSVKVFPDTLNFVKLHETRTFKVVVKGKPMPKGTQILSALLEWTDSKHIVRSNILIYREKI
ncbi:subtilisin-like protease SBT4.15 isoform X2 [Cucumis sativus]|uniref:subtilisin-like protease SBT4.15 isoform X2 n=1 Tax=Cucumis sativus TaxID=3659 RepID=UPI0012F4EEAE|nr:subtilisin-like protease SBT4.15 isoform X2 [Cucumis sativus]